MSETRSDTRGGMRAHVDKYAEIYAPLLIGLIFLAGMALLGWRDHQATERCHALSGQTEDSGQHCHLGDGRTVSTR